MYSEDEVLRVAALARLNISPEELPKLTREFNAILDYVRQLEGVDVAGVEPMCHVHGAAGVFRDDLTEPSLPADQALLNAPDTRDSFIRVPIIIE